MKKMKMNNKGFSLVELIIVIAIMAILAGALAPALIKYIASSRRSADVNNANTLATAITTALQDESAYDDLMSLANNGTVSATVPTAAPASGSGSVFWKAVDEGCSGGLAAVNKIKSKKDKTGTAISDTAFTMDYDSTTDKLELKIGNLEVYPDVASAMK